MKVSQRIGGVAAIPVQVLIEPVGEKSAGGSGGPGEAEVIGEREGETTEKQIGQ